MMIKPRDPLLKLQLTHRPQSRQVWCLYVCGNPIQLSENHHDFKLTDVIFKFEIYIIISIPSRRPQTNSEPFCIENVSVSFRNCLQWLLAALGGDMLCCLWRGAILKRLLVEGRDFLNVGGGEGATAVSSSGKGGSLGLGSSGATS